jgi:GntR family transcriptional repressor for pyruvate dehydrogenase complex
MPLRQGGFRMASKSAAMDISMDGPTRTKPAASVKNLQVRAEKLSHLVAERLRSQIATGEIAAGDTLPSETELMKQMGVSRPTLREAMRVLESEGLLQLGRGARSGAAILAPSIDRAARYGALYLTTQGTTIGDIHQVRTLLEPPLAAQHAENAKKQVIRSLQECVAEQENALAERDYLRAVAAVNDFHGQLVRYSPNNALKLLAGMLHDISANIYPLMALNGTRSDQQLVYRRTHQSTESHGKLVKLIAAGKAAEAERFWREYMRDTAAFMAKNKLDSIRVKAS